MAQKKVKYPIATIALYGPDDKITTKVVVGIIKGEDSEPILKSWVSNKILNNDNIRGQIKKYLSEHKVGQTVVTEGNIGCIHEEGLDFPLGGDCPFCPFWKGKQGSGRVDITEGIDELLF